jgi:phenylalanyl-tRNA synthetase beta chain
MLEGANRVRRSLVPSLLAARQHNESLANEVIELFEIARIYLPVASGLPREAWTLALVSGRGYGFVKGVIEQLLDFAGITAALVAGPIASDLPLLQAEQTAELSLAGERFGFLGDVSAAGKKQFGLRAAATVAEVDLGLLLKHARLIPQHAALSRFPPMSRDLNLVVEEAVRWSDLAATVQAAAGPLVESVRYQETYRDPQQKDGAGKKRLLFSFALRASDRTLTGDEADQVRDAVVAACHAQHGAELLR